jgi:hypothetical protein
LAFSLSPSLACAAPTWTEGAALAVTTVALAITIAEPASTDMLALTSHPLNFIWFPPKTPSLLSVAGAWTLVLFEHATLRCERAKLSLPDKALQGGALDVARVAYRLDVVVAESIEVHAKK